MITPCGGGGGGCGCTVKYVQITSNVVVTATDEATANMVVNDVQFVADGTTAYLFDFFAVAVRPEISSDGSNVSLWLFEDSVSLGRIGLVQQAANAFPDAMFAPVRLARIYTPTAAEHSFTIRASVNTPTGIVVAGAGGTNQDSPAFCHVTAT